MGPLPATVRDISVTSMPRVEIKRIGGYGPGVLVRDEGSRRTIQGADTF